MVDEEEEEDPEDERRAAGGEGEGQMAGKPAGMLEPGSGTTLLPVGTLPRCLRASILTQEGPHHPPGTNGSSPGVSRNRRFVSSLVVEAWPWFCHWCLQRDHRIVDTLLPRNE